MAHVCSLEAGGLEDYLTFTFFIFPFFFYFRQDDLDQVLTEVLESCFPN